MKYTQKAPCPECPYTGNTPGWIGGHDHPQEFHDAVLQDSPFPCHCSVNATGESIQELAHPNSKTQHCVGYMLYMNRMCKASKNRETYDRQRELRPLNHLALDPFKKEVVTVHLEGLKNKYQK